MKYQTGDVMPAGRRSIKGIIDGVKKPSQRMPIRLIEFSQGPGYGLRGKALMHVSIRQNVRAIVIIDKRVMANRAIDYDCKNSEQNANCDKSTLVKWSSGFLPSRLSGPPRP
jgi:hypothetical protein